MANLTITVDEETLKRARIRAIERGESVNAYLGEVLRRYAAVATQVEAFAEADAVADAYPSSSGASGRTWSREELHRY